MMVNMIHMFRVCDECFGKITDAETNSLSKFFDTRYTGYLAYNIFISPYNIFQQPGEAAEPGRGQEPAMLRGGG